MRSQESVTAEGLWKRNRDLAEACLDHPFVQGIASGKLALGRFQLFLAQDAYFLQAFARAYALALAKSPDRAGLLVFKDLLEGTFEELELHQGYAARWGISLESEPLPPTSAYCDFLLRTASLEPVGHTTAAMTPCMRLYSFLGHKLAPQLDPLSRYREWIETYSSCEFEALSSRLEGLLDRYGGDPERMAWLYRHAMQLELGFFETAWEEDAR